MTWLLFAFFSLFALVGSELSQKISLTGKKNLSAITNNFYVWTFQGVGGLVLALALGGFLIPTDTQVWLKLLLNGVIYFIGGTLYYTSYKANSASISIILGSFSAIVSTSLGILFLGEEFSLLKLLGVALVLAGIAYVNYSKELKFSIPNLYALGGGVAFGIAYTIDKSVVISNVHPAMYVGMLCLTVAFVSLVFGMKRIISETKLLVSVDFKPIASSAFFGTLFNVFTQFAYINGGDVGKIDAINNSTVFGVIMIELLVFKERSNSMKKIIAATLAVVGIILFTVKF